MPTEPFYDTSYGKLLRCLFGKPLLFQNNITLTVGKNDKSSKTKNREHVNFFGFMDVSYGIDC